jgi:hypothetical protein
MIAMSEMCFDTLHNEQEIDSMNLPEQSKLTCKGNVPEKLAKVGVDASELLNYTVAIETTDVDVTVLAEQIAEQVIDAVIEAEFDGVFETVNGEGYMEQWKAEIVRSVSDIAIGTAVQGRAFKQTVCANSEQDEDGNPTCTMDCFASDGKAGKSKEAKANPFAQA